MAYLLKTEISRRLPFSAMNNFPPLKLPDFSENLFLCVFNNLNECRMLCYLVSCIISPIPPKYKYWF